MHSQVRNKVLKQGINRHNPIPLAAPEPDTMHELHKLHKLHKLHRINDAVSRTTGVAIYSKRDIAKLLQA